MSPRILRASEARFLFQAAGTELAVLDFTAHEGVSIPYEVNLTLVSEDEIKFDDMVGKEAYLEIAGEGAERYFHGILSTFAQGGTKGKYYLYQARMVPSLWMLSLEHDCRIFQEKNVQDIVKQILQDGGIPSDRFEFRVQSQYPTRTYCVQYRENDLQFVSRLLEEEGIFYFFEHSKSKHLLVFGDSTVNYKPIQGEAGIPYNPAEGMVPQEECVYGFSMSQQVHSGKFTQRDFNFERPSLDLTTFDQAKSYQKQEVYDYPGIYLDQKRGKDLAQIRLQELTVFREKAEGKSVCPRFTPGFTFKLTEHERSGLNREYFLIDIVHRGTQPQALQEMASKKEPSQYTNEFAAIPSKVTMKPERHTPKPVVKGVQTAIVVGPKGEEIYTDKYGRVKVQFHWDREGKRDEKSSCWIRVSQGWAGPNWGAMFVPRIGHEVIVDFIEGDPDRPIITGRVYHGTNSPPYPLPDEKTKSTVISNSSLGGGGFNELRFEDKKGQEEIFLHGQKDWTIAIENDKNQTVGHDETLQVVHNRSIQVGVNHAESIGANMSLNVGNNRSETVAVASTETVGAAKALTIGAAYQVTVGGAMNETVGAAKAEEIGGAKVVAVGAQSSESIGGNKSLDAGGDISENAGKKLTVRSGKKMSFQADDDYAVKGGKKGVVEMADELVLKCGDASITLTKNGDVVVKGKNISVKGSGDVILKGSSVKAN